MLLITRIALSAFLALITIVVAILWLTNDLVAGIIGGIISAAATTAILLPEKERATWIWAGALALVPVGATVFMTLAFSGALGNVGRIDPRGPGVLALQWAWVLLALALALVVIPLRDRQVLGQAVADHRARAAADAEAARRERDERHRREELERAAQVERVRRAQDRATRPGAVTGYEPQRLAHIVLEHPARMFGSPGAGLGGSGFDARSVKRGQEGEVNFAKALQKDGLLDRFATFWSVHVPDEELGASTRTQADVDCVLVSGSTVWLLDMKNYQQGDVLWRVDGYITHTPEGHIREELVLSATDAVTGGYVGRPRRMSMNMSLATEAFRTRMSRSGLRFDLRPVVVLMPQADGLGTIDDVFYPGGVPAVGLPTLLGWLDGEPDYDETAEDAVILHAIMSQLLKDDTGSAIMLDPQTGRRMNTPQHDGTAFFE